jgi:hypothetical protein
MFSLGYGEIGLGYLESIIRNGEIRLRYVEFGLWQLDFRLGYGEVDLLSSCLPYVEFGPPCCDISLFHAEFRRYLEFSQSHWEIV